MVSPEVPEMAAARCSLTHDFAVPGWPARSSARSEARVAMATWISRRSPTNFGVIGTGRPSGPVTGLSLPMTNISTSRGESCQPGGRG